MRRLRVPAIKIALLQGWIKIDKRAIGLAVLKVEIEGHVVDATGAIADVFDRNVEIARQFIRSPLHGMAKAYLPDLRIFGGYRPGVDRHRVYILEHDGIRADLHHVIADRPQMWNSADAPHDAADAECICYGLAQPEFLRHFKVGDCTGFKTADLKRNDHKICTSKRHALIGIGFYACGPAQRFREFAHNDFRFFKPLRIDIHQPDFSTRQRRALQDVPCNVLRKHC